MVVIEAMASGLPVVSSNVFGIAEQVIDGDTGFPFDPGDVEGMAGALWRLSMEPSLRTRMGKRGRFVAERLYGIDRMVDAYAREFRLLREELG
ncbi:glycosyltransferase [Azospirillum sp. B506]|uniref:glycosyltransferase n=1 Tax=Azospirillum sp. B506 TaxID=137721 RepID=UPI00034C9782|nr:glycosyltransferase [Azospirillum sp. B506]